MIKIKFLVKSVISIVLIIYLLNKIDVFSLLSILKSSKLLILLAPFLLIQIGILIRFAIIKPYVADASTDVAPIVKIKGLTT